MNRESETGGQASDSGWRQTAPTWVTIGVLVVIGAGALVTRKGGGAQGPETVVYAAFDAAAKGDANTYLGCFGGEMAQKIAAARRESGEARFAADLRERAGAITGLAVSRAAESGGSGPADAALLRVEQVFRDRNEKQDFLLRRRWGGWRIHQIGPAATVKMPIPYGTPVYAEEPAPTNAPPQARK